MKKFLVATSENYLRGCTTETKQSSCVTEKGISPTKYQVLALLVCSSPGQGGTTVPAGGYSGISPGWVWESPRMLTDTQTFEFFTIGVSVRLSDRSLHKEEQKKNFIKICPQWGLKPGPPDGDWEYHSYHQKGPGTRDQGKDLGETDTC